MSANDRSAGSSRNPECNAVAPLLALRETGLLEAEETSRVERHLASCSVCQRDAALDDALAGRLRRALLPGARAASTLSMEEIMRATERHVTDAPIDDAPEARPAVERPIIRPRSTVARWGTGLSAVAAVLALVLFATYIFGRFAPMGGVDLVGPIPTLSPLLAQQTVYLPTDAGVYALRASDGVVRWTYPAGIAKAPVTHAQAIYGLALDHGTLYTLAATLDYPPGHPEAQLLALNARDGAVRWSRVIPGLGNASLLKVGNLLIVAPLGPAQPDASRSVWAVVAFSATDGDMIWGHGLDEAPLSSPTSAGGSIFIGTATHVIALSAANGVTRWTTGIVPAGAYQEGTKPAKDNLSVALATSGNLVYVLAKRTITSSDGATTLEANVYAFNSADGSYLTRYTFENEPLETAFAPVLVGDIAYVPGLGGTCAISGPTYQRDIQWRFIPKGSTTRNEAMTGAAVSGGVVYTTDLYGILTRHDGVNLSENFTFAVRASDGVELWRTPTNGGLTALTPVAASGLVLAPSRGQVKALRAADGHQVWMFATPAGSAVGAPLLG